MSDALSSARPSPRQWLASMVKRGLAVALVACGLGSSPVMAAQVAVAGGSDPGSVVLSSQAISATSASDLALTVSADATGPGAAATAVWNSELSLVSLANAPSGFVTDCALAGQFAASPGSQAALAGVDVNLRLPGVPNLRLSGLAGSRDGIGEASADWSLIVRYAELDLAFTGTASATAGVVPRRSLRPGLVLDLSPIPGLAPRSLLMGLDMLVLQEGPISDVARSLGLRLAW